MARAGRTLCIRVEALFAGDPCQSFSFGVEPRRFLLGLLPFPKAKERHVLVTLKRSNSEDETSCNGGGAGA